ncbi:FmdB family zinc ribbon protein [[Pseudomonas] boreopolis]|uniref:FmdB family zinc ribbon protein n=1 Tax=Xanthomonas boreopolis TaxID=86183 RepID=UPI003D373A24
MPIYAFQCAACGHAFDRLQKLSDPDPTTCPACAAAAVKRQVTAPAFRLSGTGWYETDFKSKGEKKKNLADAASAGDSAAAAPAPTKAEALAAS